MSGLKQERPGYTTIPRVAMFACTLVSAMVALLLTTTIAKATPLWQVESEHGPTQFEPGAMGQYVIRMRNSGDSAQAGTVTLTDTLPSGMTATDVETLSSATDPWACDGVGTSVVICTRDATSDGQLIAPPDQVAPPNGQRGFGPAVAITVAVAPDATGTLNNQVTLVGGGGVDAAATDATVISNTNASPGFLAGSVFGDVFDAAAPDGAPVRTAGTHPFELRVGFGASLKLTSNAVGTYVQPEEDPRTIEAKMPPGFIGNPEAVAECTGQQLQSQSCPVASQVGSMDLVLSNENAFVEQNSVSNLAVYKVSRPKGAIVAFGFLVGPATVQVTVTLDPVDHAVVATISGVPETFQLHRAQLTLWGVPADHAHDALRVDGAGGVIGVPSPDAANPQPFLTLPSSCSDLAGPQLAMDSWTHPASFVNATTPDWVMTGCDDPRMRFEPSLTVQPDVRTPTTPTGLDVMLSVPQKDDTEARDASQLYGRAESDFAIPTPPLRNVKVILPVGMSISPSSANGLEGCSPTQIDLASNDDATCPDAAKIGTLSIVTPVLPEPLEGSVYYATQNDNPFGTTFALYLVAQGQGVTLKLAGKIASDPLTGQLTATFDDNPQFPFSTLHMRLKSGDRAPLVTSSICGPQTATATMTSWNALLPVVDASDSFTISADGKGAPCTGQGFDPKFTAGTTNPTSGADSPIVTRFTRTDTDEEFDAADISLPPGLLGRIADVRLCSASDAKAGTCAEASRVGTVTIGAGPGSSPFFITDGKAYITEGYGGAPFGLSIVVHAKAGPIDLGNVVTLAKILIDKQTAALRVVSDPLPRILAGVPLKIRVVDVTIDRPHFTFNPTNCSVLHSTATLHSIGGKTATKMSRFQVGDCASLAFHPKMVLQLGRKGHTAFGKSTPLVTTLTMSKGDANIAGVQVVLPDAINARLPVITRACTLDQFRARDCEKARAGSAVASTPLLKHALRGGAYFVKNGHPLPDLMIALRGQVAVDLDGKVSIPGNTRLATSFTAVPDVPIKKFVLTLVDGHNGPIGIAEDLCSKKGRQSKAQVNFRGQNGRVVIRKQALRIMGCVRSRTAKGGARDK